MTCICLDNILVTIRFNFFCIDYDIFHRLLSYLLSLINMDIKSISAEGTHQVVRLALFVAAFFFLFLSYLRDFLQFQPSQNMCTIYIKETDDDTDDYGNQ